jgi:hypothetical protein
MATLTQTIRMKIPKNGETSAVSGSYAKAINDAITGATTVRLTTIRKGKYIVATIFTS